MDGYGINYSKDDISFTFPAVIRREVVTQKPADNPHEIDFAIVQFGFFDGILRGSSSEIFGRASHLGIQSLELFWTLHNQLP